MHWERFAEDRTTGKRDNGNEHSSTLCGKFFTNDILKDIFEADMTGEDRR
jgi:hypothetical protein